MRSVFPWALLALFVCVEARTAQRQQPVSAQITSLTDKDARTKASVHPAFANAGRQAGVEVWRIVDFNPVAVAQNDVGKFNKGDSYIVLKISIASLSHAGYLLRYERDANDIKFRQTTADKKNNLSWDIYYWIGSESTQDESGAAAILTVGLDDKFNGAAVQHRETLGQESQQFQSLFRPAIRYIDGGAASGFNHVVTNPGAEKRFFQVKGKQNIRVRQVDPLIASMNKGDCFILDINNDVFVYVGDSANHKERLKANSFANQVRDQDHNGRGRVDIVDQYSSDADVERFFTALGSGTRNIVPEASAGGDDQAFEKSEENSVTLTEISDSTGSLVATPQRKPLRQELLKPQETYILDTVSGGVYVWLGRQATKRVHVTRIPQGTEPAAFKQYFATWRDAGMSHTRLVRSVAFTTTDMKHRNSTNYNWLEPKLYKAILTKEGTMAFQEIPDFEKTYLKHDSVYVIEKGDEMHVWVGDDVPDAMRKVTNDIHPWHVIMVKQDFEPKWMTQLFSNWNPDFLEKSKEEEKEVIKEKYDALNFNEFDDD